jgi:hypothetical protein
MRTFAKGTSPMSLLQKGTAALAAIIITGCATVKPVAIGGGETAQLISGCGSLEECVNLAVKACPNGYTVLNQVSEDMGGAVHGTTYKYYVPYGTSTDMLIKCNESAKAAPAPTQTSPR